MRDILVSLFTPWRLLAEQRAEADRQTEQVDAEVARQQDLCEQIRIQVNRTNGHLDQLEAALLSVEFTELSSRSGDR